MSDKCLFFFEIEMITHWRVDTVSSIGDIAVVPLFNNLKPKLFLWLKAVLGAEWWLPVNGSYWREPEVRYSVVPVLEREYWYSPDVTQMLFVDSDKVDFNIHLTHSFQTCPIKDFAEEEEQPHPLS